MSEELRKFITAWPVILFIGGVIFSSGVLWANFYGHIRDGHPETLTHRVIEIENNVKWLRAYFESPRR
jgi:hypothetical protein